MTIVEDGNLPARSIKTPRESIFADGSAREYARLEADSGDGMRAHLGASIFSVSGKTLEFRGFIPISKVC